MNKLFFGLFVILMSIGIVSADIGDYNQCGMGGMMYGTYGIGMALLGWLFMILIVIALIVFIIWMIKQIQKNSNMSKRK